MDHVHNSKRDNTRACHHHNHKTKAESLISLPRVHLAWVDFPIAPGTTVTNPPIVANKEM
jgi:hypothetical protein